MRNSFTARVACLPILKPFVKKSKMRQTVLRGVTRESQTFLLISVFTRHMVIAQCYMSCCKYLFISLVIATHKKTCFSIVDSLVWHAVRRVGHFCGFGQITSPVTRHHLLTKRRYINKYSIIIYIYIYRVKAVLYQYTHTGVRPERS